MFSHTWFVQYKHSKNSEIRKWVFILRFARGFFFGRRLEPENN